MRKLFLHSILVFTLVFSTHADVSTPLDIECCISINEKLDEQTDILKQQYELNAKNEQVINKIYEKVTDTPNADMTYKDWLNIIGTLFGSLLGAGVAIFVFKKGIKHEKEKERSRKKSFLKSISIILNDIVNTCNRRIKSINTYAEDVNSNPWNQNKLGIISTDKISRIKNIDITQMANAFFEFHIDEKSYIDLYSKLDYIHDLFKNIENDYFKHIHDYVTNPSNEIIEITRWTSEFIFIKLQSGEFNIIRNQIEKQYETFQEKITENLTNINYINENFTIPYLELFSDSRVSEKAFEALSKLKRAKDLYSFICDGNIKFSQDLLIIQKNINKCIVCFNSIIKDINLKIDYKPEQNNSSQNTNPSKTSIEET